jgi:hypothetical protein
MSLIVIKWCRTVKVVREVFEDFSESMMLAEVDEEEAILV